MLVALVLADIYMHHPRGSNNRCDETSNNRNNANRLFDSENNAAGGYATCNRVMEYYEETEMWIQWTAQHGCGNGRNAKDDPLFPSKSRCEFVIQVGCEDGFGKDAGLFDIDDYELTDGVPPVAYENGNNNGYCTDTRPLPEDCTDDQNQPQCANLDMNVAADRATLESDACRCSPLKMTTYGLHEPFRYYDKCRTRHRNMGLYVANRINPNDQNRRTAIFTRQNQNGNRHGYECPEERDYYPYFHYTPWRDIAVITSDMSICDEVQQNSQNVKPRHECINENNPDDEEYWIYNNKKECETTETGAPRTNAKWVETPAWNLPAPECIQAPYLLDNHLGQAAPSISDDENTEAGQAQTYKWRIPSGILNGQDEQKCTIRVRYNISTAEVARTFTAADNGKVKNNPLVQIGDYDDNPNADPSQVLPLKVQLNTNQNPRGFEDRSYVFKVKKRPDSLKDKNIVNLNVRGKRGNIAQVRNNVEYDFVPDDLKVNVGDMVHFQWCGSDYNDKNNAGQGLDGTDRSNLVPVSALLGNVPGSIKSTNLFAQKDLEKLAWIDQTDCYSTAEIIDQNENRNDGQVQDDPKSCQYLNGAKTPYFSHMAEVKETGNQCFVSTRNNNFSNRSQKMCMHARISTTAQTMVAVGIGVGIFGFVAAVAIAFYVIKRRYGSGFVLLRKYNPYPKQI